jgi:hypothetical protein
MDELELLSRITDPRKRPPVDVSVRELVTDEYGDVICALSHGIVNEVEYRERNATIVKRY